MFPRLLLSFLPPNLCSLPQACSRSQKISGGWISRPIQLPLCELETFWLPQAPNSNSSNHGGHWDPSFPLPRTAAWASQVVPVVKNQHANAEDMRRGLNPWVRRIPWRRAWQPNPSILAWRIPRTEKPGRLQSIRSERVRRNRSLLHTHAYCPLELTPGTKPEKSHGSPCLFFHPQR